MSTHSPDPPPDDSVPDFDIAIAAEALFLINLLLLPGLAFLVLMALWAIHHDHPDPIARNHLRQTGWTCIWGGLLLVVISTTILLLGGFDNPWTWVIGILYFTFIHSTLVLLGIVGLSRAINRRVWRYPVLGPRERS
ncbi:MAG: hypothetical protein ABTQ28_16865 [Thauera sp.]|jgi:hypothetical protein